MGLPRSLVNRALKDLNLTIAFPLLSLCLSFTSLGEEVLGPLLSKVCRIIFSAATLLSALPAPLLIVLITR